MIAIANGRERWDAVVIGGGVGGLVAAAYLARAGQRVVLVEARNAFGGRAETGALTEGVLAPVAVDTLYALDRIAIRDLRLRRRGLRFAVRAMGLAALRPGGRHLVLAQELFAARGAVRAEHAADAGAFLRYRRRLFALARRLRPFWTPELVFASRRLGGGVDYAARSVGLSAADAARLDLIARCSATAYLDRWFESPVLKSALGLDAAIAGLAPDEAGSALLLLWRAAQECCGLQGAAGQVLGGPGSLADALAGAAREAGAELRSGARAAQILVGKGRVEGVALTDGGIYRASTVLSSLSPRQTLAELLPPDALPLGAVPQFADAPRVAGAKVLFALDGAPPFAGLSPRALRRRLLIVERPESAAESKGAALLGALPDELVLEATVPTAADGSLAAKDKHVLSVRVSYLPASPRDGWPANEETLKKRVLTALSAYAPGIADRVTAAIVLTPDDFRVRYGADDPGDAACARLLLPYEARLRTPLAGLYLCGGAAEPADAVSGRAGRLAAALALAERRRAEGGSS